jgi:hypothetical protein
MRLTTPSFVLLSLLDVTAPHPSRTSNPPFAEFLWVAMANAAQSAVTPR